MSAGTVEIPKQRGGRGSGFSSISALSRPDIWASDLELRVDGRPFSTRGREYVVPIMRDQSDLIVCPKGAQTAFTATALTKTLHYITIRKWHGAYILPVKVGAIPFVQGRIDSIIDSADELRKQFSNVDNKLHKQTTDAINLYVRGTNIQRELQEFPVDFQIWDERDRFVEDFLSDALERMSGSMIGKLMMLSTPTIPGFGIDVEWQDSDQHRWEIPCPGCNRYQVLNRKENLQIGKDKNSCVLECVYCKRAFKDEERFAANAVGRWVPTFLNGNARGYHLSQFNSPTRKLHQVMENYFLGQTDGKKLESWFNNGMGEPFVAPGNRVTPELLDKCRSAYELGGIPEGPVFVGVDVGTKLHVKCDVIARGGYRRAWRMLILNNFAELDDFLSQLTTFVCVIDAFPEKEKARELSIKFQGKVWLGFEQDRPQQAEIAAWMPVHFGEAAKVNIDRTMAFDTTIAEMMNGKYLLPRDARELGEHMPRLQYNGFYAQLCEQARREEEDAQGRMRAHWKKTRNPDHWHHADMFAKIASLGKPMLSIPAGIGQAFQEAGNPVGA